MSGTKVKAPIKKGAAKVPVIIQLEALECGAASLCMVLAYYDKWIPLAQVRQDCGVSRDGSKASNILKAARKYGLKATGYRYEPEQLKASGSFPCIIHWNFNHFVVLNGFKGNKAYINDPAKGTCILPMEQFDKAFTGVCIQFEPGEGFTPEGKPASTLSFAKKRLRGTMGAFVFVTATTVITSMLGIIEPAFSRIFMDRLLTQQNPEWLYPLLIGIALFTVVSFIVEWIRMSHLLKINGKLAVTANASFMWHVLRLPMNFFSQRMAGDIATRQQMNESIANTLISVLAPLVLNGVMLVFYLVVMLRYSVLLTIVGLAAMLVNILMAQLIAKRRVNVTRVMMRDQGKLAGATVAGIEMIETIKASGAENGYFEKWAGYQAGVNTQKVNFSKIENYLGMIPQMVTQLSNVIVLALGVWLVMEGQFTIGMVMAFQGFLLSFYAPAQGFIQVSRIMQEMRTNMERIEDIMQYPTDVKESEPYDENKSYSKLSGEVEMKNVSFGYSPLEKPLIEGFNLTLHPGSRVAFVGSSGCGKSTLAKLISGLYKPWEGKITFDGKPLEEIDHSIFTGSVAVVDQDIILFEDTISNNLKMWDSSIEDFEIILAARDANLHEDIMQRDGGYGYKLLEGGKDLSGGQRQRLEIARVLSQDPTILIMDEATSALDAKTEYEVVKAIKDRGITCIVIAHRLSTIRDCDEIIVMDQGKVVERGTHDVLFRQGGLYTSLVSNE